MTEKALYRGKLYWVTEQKGDMYHLSPVTGEYDDQCVMVDFRNSHLQIDPTPEEIAACT